MNIQDTKNQNFDLIVIGTGVAATTVAYNCHSNGLSTAIIDSRPYGGTCALRGCDPKKILAGAAELTDWISRVNDSQYPFIKYFKNENHLPKINWNVLMNFKKTFTDPVPQNKEDGFNKSGIVTFHGIAKFIAPNVIEIFKNFSENKVGNDTQISNTQSKEHIIKGNYIVIASGSKPVPLSIEGENYLTFSDDFLELSDLPENIVFVGGGYISFEFAHIAARAGSKVKILHRSKSPLSNFDTDLVSLLIKKSQDLGIDIVLNSPVTKIERLDQNTDPGKYLVHFSNDDKKINTVEADIVVHGAGRVPNIQDLSLDKGNIDHTTKGITVNEYLQSVSNPSVYSAGDAANTNGLPLTPVAGYEGGIVSNNILHGNKITPNYDGIPSVVFTIPVLASVGITEQEARKMNLKYKVNYSVTSNWYTSKRILEKYSAFKIIIENTDTQDANNKILGAHLLGHNSEEVINIFSLAMRLGLGTEQIKKCIFSYPTNSYDVNYMV